MNSFNHRLVELGVADPAADKWNDANAQRVQLKRGDSFFVPPGNIYRLENHSRRKSCTLFWTISKPLQQTQEGGLAEGDSS